MGIAPRRAEVTDSERLLKSPGCRDDLPEYGGNRLPGEGTFVVRSHSGKNLLLPLRNEYAAGVLFLSFADLQGQFCPLIQQIDQLVVDLVDLFPDVVYLHEDLLRVPFEALMRIYTRSQAFPAWHR